LRQYGHVVFAIINAGFSAIRASTHFFTTVGSADDGGGGAVVNAQRTRRTIVLSEQRAQWVSEEVSKWVSLWVSERALVHNHLLDQPTWGWLASVT
jgi:hypothetical protein